MIVLVTDLNRHERRVYEDVAALIDERQGDEPRVVLGWPNGDEVELFPWRQRIEVLA